MHTGKGKGKHQEQEKTAVFGEWDTSALYMTEQRAEDFTDIQATLRQGHSDGQVL